MGTCLESLVRELEAAMEASANGHRLRLEVGRELQPAPDRAVAIGLMGTELVTNACKPAYPADAGEIRVGLYRQSDGRLLLAVVDDGGGWAGASEPQGTGLGYRFINAMAATLEAKLAYDPQPMVTRAVVQFAG